MLPDTACQQLATAGAFCGVAAAIIGSGSVAWNVQGIATGFWLAAVHAWVNE